MRKIFKYELGERAPTLRMPKGARVLCVAEQGWEYHLWAEVDPEEPNESRRFAVVATGAEVPYGGKYIGTIHSTSGLVWHVYEELRHGEG